MFKPLDLLAFDTDWPIANGKIENLKDIRVVVKNVPSQLGNPCAIGVTQVSNYSLTFCLCTRSTHLPDLSTALSLTKETSGSLGKVYHGSNNYMDIDITTGEGSFNLSAGATPLLIVPCCVLWLKPCREVFDLSVLPDPESGWTRDIDYRTRRITYKGNPPGVATTASSTANAIRLRNINGQSLPDISIVADGEGSIDVDEQTITIKPGLRDTDDTGRIL